MNGNATSLRLFGKYLLAVGKEAYVLPDKMFVVKKTEQPYMFTNSDLVALFKTIDNLSKPCYGDTIMIPTLFRLIYTCGLRPNER